MEKRLRYAMRKGQKKKGEIWRIFKISLWVG